MSGPTFSINGPTFSINFDYRCPFARNANEHVLAAIEARADYEVKFRAFSLSQVHVAEGDAAIWDDPEKRPDLIALAAGVVVRDKFPGLFPAAHISLFAARHDDGDDLRDESIVRKALTRAGVDAEAVFAELETDEPFETVKSEHEESVAVHSVFGVPTFIAGTEAAFVRLMTRPNGDGKLARKTIDHVIELLSEHAALNEYKHTTIPR